MEAYAGLMLMSPPSSLPDVHRFAFYVLILGFIGLIISAGSIYFGSQSEIEDVQNSAFGRQLVGLGCLGTVFSWTTLVLGTILAIALNGNQATSGQVILAPSSPESGGQSSGFTDNETENSISSKTKKTIQIGILIGLIILVSLLISYFLIRYFIWYFDEYIGPSWL